MVSAVILYLLRLIGDESVSYVEARKKEVRLAGIAIKEAQESVSKPMSVMMAVSTDLIDSYVLFTRQNRIFKLPSSSLEFRNAARN